jgi:hypothetical protein
MAKFFAIAMAVVFAMTASGMSVGFAGEPGKAQSSILIAKGKSGEDHGKSAEEHGKAGEERKARRKVRARRKVKGHKVRHSCLGFLRIQGGVDSPSALLVTFPVL